MKSLPIVLAALGGLVVGIFAGRAFFSAPAGGGQESADPTTATAGEIFHAEAADAPATGRPARTSGDKPAPLTFDLLVSELSKWETAGRAVPRPCGLGPT